MSDSDPMPFDDGRTRLYRGNGRDAMPRSEIYRWLITGLGTAVGMLGGLYGLGVRSDIAEAKQTKADFAQYRLDTAEYRKQQEREAVHFGDIQTFLLNQNGEQNARLTKHEDNDAQMGQRINRLELRMLGERNGRPLQ